MKKLLWFTETSINCTKKTEFGKSFTQKSTDLTKYLKIFNENKIWEKDSYRNEYVEKYTAENLAQIKSVNIHVNIGATSSLGWHAYENVVEHFVGKDKIEREKLLASGISEATKMAIVEVEYESNYGLIKNLSYEEEKDVEKTIEFLGGDNHAIWQEQNKIKNIICEFIQFYVFNLHMNFLTIGYDFNFKQKSNPIGFIAYCENEHVYYETNKTDLLSHYILWEEEYELLNNYMDITSKFWCKYISSIHFFLDALKGNYITSANFIKLVFTLESFYSKGISNDYISLVNPLLISTSIGEMKKFRQIIRKSFSYRNEIVHGTKVHNIKENDEMADLFFELKNIVTRTFAYFINNELYLKDNNSKLNHELVFNLFPKGIANK